MTKATLARLTTDRIGNGLFIVYFDGVKTEWEIYNGCAGSSGVGGNIYGVHKAGTDKFSRVGSLAACKKRLALTLSQEGGI